jgi:hypothetical protein
MVNANTHFSPILRASAVGQFVSSAKKAVINAEASAVAVTGEAGSRRRSTRRKPRLCVCALCAGDERTPKGIRLNGRDGYWHRNEEANC